MLIVVLEAVHSRVWAGLLIGVVLGLGVEGVKLVEDYSGFGVWMLIGLVVGDGLCAWLFVGHKVVVEVHSGG